MAWVERGWACAMGLWLMGCSLPHSGLAILDAGPRTDHAVMDAQDGGDARDGGDADVPTACPTGQSRCGAQCVATDTDPANCGGCGTVCTPTAHAAVACSAGACTMGACETGWVDCNGMASDGCELQPGAACSVPGMPCAAGGSACGGGGAVCVATGHDVAVNTACGAGMVCSASGACTANVVSAAVNCATGPRTADQLCIAATGGFAGATSAEGYLWGECGGLPDCPVGWTGDGTVCASWCSATDCVGVSLCPGGTSLVHAQSSSESTTFDPDALDGCTGGGNPGWLVRLVCHY